MLINLSSTLYSSSRPLEEEASVPRAASLEVEDESFDADLCGVDWIESNESFDSVKAGDHDCARIPYRSTREENRSRNADVDDANVYDGWRSRAVNELRTSHNSCNA